MILSFSLGVCICFLKSVEVLGIAEKGMCFGLKPSRSGFYFLIFPVWFCILASEFWIGIRNSLIIFILASSIRGTGDLKLWFSCSCSIGKRRKKEKKNSFNAIYLGR